jgi:hypothetical protein
MAALLACATGLGVAATIVATHRDAPPEVKIAPPRETVSITVPACVYLDGKADRKCNPGSINPAVTQANLRTTICAPKPPPGHKSWIAQQRPPTSYTSQLRDIQMSRYGLTATDPGQEIREDHVIALEIGGHPRSPDNLFPQRYADSLSKDLEEDYLHDQVCKDLMTLADAQQRMLADWTH